MTENEFYHDKIEQMAKSLNEMNRQLSVFLTKLETFGEKQTDHEARLRKLEGWKDRSTGIISFVTFVLGAVVTETLRSFM